MANQQRRPQRARTRTTRSQTLRTTTSTGPGLAPTAAPEVEEVRVARQVDWANEYKYVYTDIRHLFVVAGIIFALLLVIGFFL